MHRTSTTNRPAVESLSANLLEKLYRATTSIETADEEL